MLDPVGLELQAAISYHMVPGTLEEQPVVLTTEPSPALEQSLKHLLGF